MVTLPAAGRCEVVKGKMITFPLTISLLPAADTFTFYIIHCKQGRCQLWIKLEFNWNWCKKCMHWNWIEKNFFFSKLLEFIENLYEIEINYNWYQLIAMNWTEAHIVGASSTAPTQPPPMKRNKFFALVNQFSVLAARPQEAEVTLYLSQPCIQEDNDPLGYWTAKQSELPILAMLAINYLAIPTTVAPV